MKLKVAVICGGRSGEHDVSLKSAESIVSAMDPARYDVARITISKEGKWNPRPILPEPGANPGIDIVFPVLHGTFGEDGTVQGLLELADLPYVGAGVLASAVSMDKEMMKRVCRERGLPIVESVAVSRARMDTLQCPFDFPVFVKPANLGSSVGISKAANPSELQAALKLAGGFDRKIIVERAIAGREFECSVLGNEDPQAAVPCEILPSRNFYDYEDKYLAGTARAVLPAEIPAELAEEIRRLAVACYQAVECEGLARVDFLYENSTGRLYINEINTLPGFTAISMYPKMWEASGLAYSKLIDRLIELALARHQDRLATKYTR